MCRICATGWAAPLAICLLVPSSAVARASHREASRGHRSAHVARHLASRGEDARPRGVESIVRARAASAPATVTYYVSPFGSDASSGTSPATAWQTVGKVDAAALEPGTRVLFEGGATFSDQTLMPGWGGGISGSGNYPISFGSYGVGEATLTQGVWFQDENHLTFEDLVLGPSSGYEGHGFQGKGNGIGLQGLTIEHVMLGVNAAGDGWEITDSTINDTGDSGMLLGYTANAAGDPAGGSNYVVSGNTITNTGVDPAIEYGTHGIYDKVSDSVISHNTISNFKDDGISVRYRDSAISANAISNGEIGLAWFQYDVAGGSSSWTGNTISDVDMGVFVCGTGQGCLPPLETFRISGNTIALRSAAAPVSAPAPALVPAPLVASRSGTPASNRRRAVAKKARPHARARERRRRARRYRKHARRRV